MARRAALALGRRHVLWSRAASPWAVTGRALSTPASLTINDVAASLRPFTAEEVRSRFTVPSTASVADAAKHIAKHRLTFACVVDPEGCVVGMMTERDYVKFSVRADSSRFFSGRDATMGAERRRAVAPGLARSLAHSLAG